jgi:hypothetical protein
LFVTQIREDEVFLALDLDPLLKNDITVNPHWFKCGFGAGLFVNFGKFPWFWNRIRFPNADPGPGEPNQRGTTRIRIHYAEEGFKQVS